MYFNSDMRYVFSEKKYKADTNDEANWAKVANGRDVYVKNDREAVVFINLDGVLTPFFVQKKWCYELTDYTKTKQATNFKFVKQEKYNCNLNKILDSLVKKKYLIYTEIYSSTKTEVMLYSVLTNTHARVTKQKDGSHTVDYLKEISSF